MPARIEQITLKEPVFRRKVVNVEDMRTEQRAEGDSGLPPIVGYAALFDVVAEICWFTESIAVGAFTDSLSRKDDVRALFNHDVNLVLGRTKASTLSLEEDEKGLKSRILPPDTQLGRDTVVLIERGDISQMSFGFCIEAEEARYEEGQKPHYTITRAKLFDVSVVTFPAYEETEVDVERAVRSRMGALRDLDRAAAEKLLRDRQLALRRLKLGSSPAR